MTTDPLADALAELRRQTDDGLCEAAGNENARTILNAALSGDLMPQSEHLAAMAAANEAAASAFMDAVWDALKADANDLRKQQRILEAYRALTTADQQAALERVKREAREEALRPIREAVTQYHLALDRRENGNTAGYHLQDAVQRLLDMPWRQGAALAALADGEPT